MENVAVRKKLKLKYEIPASLQEIAASLEDLRLFASYYALNATTLLPDAETNLLSRLAIYAQNHTAPPYEAEIAAVAEGAKQPETAAEQWISNIQSGIDFLADKANVPVSISLLTELHKLLVANTPHAKEAGRLRIDGHNLFSFIEEGVLLPEYDDLKACLDGIIAFAEDKNVPPLVRSFLFFYVFTAIQPFAHQSETVAILATHHLLAQSNYGLFGLLNLEKHVFFNPKYLLQTAHLFGEQNYLERLDADLTFYLDICLLRFQSHIRDVKKILADVVKLEFEYDTLSARQKNAVNFWLEKGFFLHKEKLKNLTPRQHDIMTLLARYSYLTTKDIVPVFQLDRKTIQRDFNILLELGLVEQRGSGRSIRYHLDFKILF